MTKFIDYAIHTQGEMKTLQAQVLYSLLNWADAHLKAQNENILKIQDKTIRFEEDGIYFKVDVYVDKVFQLFVSWEEFETNYQTSTWRQ